ncbi:MAG: crossover junction endodeoxyribonuclease RuvC [bacterium]
MIILGIDPGLSITGWGIIQKIDAMHYTVIDQGAVYTTAHTGIAERIKIIYDSILDLIKNHAPDIMAIEKLFFMKNTSARLGVGQARGVVLLAAEQRNIPIYEYAPKEVKLAITGYGSAGKDQLSHMVKTLLRLPQVPKPDDVADALAVALCHANSYAIRDLQGVRK